MVALLPGDEVTHCNAYERAHALAALAQLRRHFSCASAAFPSSPANPYAMPRRRGSPLTTLPPMVGRRVRGEHGATLLDMDCRPMLWIVRVEAHRHILAVSRILSSGTARGRTSSSFVQHISADPADCVAILHGDECAGGRPVLLAVVARDEGGESLGLRREIESEGGEPWTSEPA
jgi:hypothetical protein